MLIAQHLKETSLAEYLLYMWQVEDLLRANKCDMSLLEKNYLSRFSLPEDQMKSVRRWYENLNDMMHHEGLIEKGHLQINKNTLADLTELHGKLLASPQYSYYNIAYYKVLLYIEEVKSRGENKEISEIEICFNILYGVMMLRLQKKEVNSETEKAVKNVTAFLKMLSDYYIQDKKEPLEF